MHFPMIEYLLWIHFITRMLYEKNKNMNIYIWFVKHNNENVLFINDR